MRDPLPEPEPCPKCGASTWVNFEVWECEEGHAGQCLECKHEGRPYANTESLAVAIWNAGAALAKIRLDRSSILNTREKIVEKLMEAYEPGFVHAGDVYKGHDYDGAREADGWWFSSFEGYKIYLGGNLAEARETIDQIVANRE